VSASGPLVIHIFVPFKMYLFPFFYALHLIDVTSEPAPDYDIAKAPMCSPEHSFGRYFIFCYYDPCRTICAKHNALCAPYDKAIEPLALDSYYIIIE
jgi:hypothetical protein